MSGFRIMSRENSVKILEHLLTEGVKVGSTLIRLGEYNIDAAGNKTSMKGVDLRKLVDAAAAEGIGNISVVQCGSMFNIILEEMKEALKELPLTPEEEDAIRRGTSRKQRVNFKSDEFYKKVIAQWRSDEGNTSFDQYLKSHGLTEGEVRKCYRLRQAMYPDVNFRQKDVLSEAEKKNLELIDQIHKLEAQNEFLLQQLDELKRSIVFLANDARGKIDTIVSGTSSVVDKTKNRIDADNKAH